MDNFNHNLVSDFSGYNSSRDKTNIKESFLVRGSKNVYKKISGTIASRFGLKRRGTADATVAGVKSSFEWSTSLAKIYPLRVSNSKLQVESNLLDGSTYVWYDLMTGLTLTRFVFDTMWDNVAKKDRCIFVKGDSNLHSWSGGLTKVSSGGGATLVKTDTTTTWLQDGFDNTTFTTIGDNTTQFTITNPSGTTFTYTWTTTGTDPAITSTSVPVGSYIYINAQNFNAANNGLFVITASAAGTFSVTNASGVAEATKTIGSGFIYTKYTKLILTNSTVFAYTGGESTTTLTGVIPSTSGVTPDIAVQVPTTTPNTPASGFTNDFIKQIGAQLFVGSYTSRLVYVSKINLYLTYAIPSPRLAGDPTLLTLDDNVKGLGTRAGLAYISAGASAWYTVKFADNADATANAATVEKFSSGSLTAALAHEFIDTKGDNIVYVSQDQQLRTIGIFRNYVEPKYPSLSQDIQTELVEEDFTGGHLRVVGDFIHITAPNNGRDWMYQERQLPDATGILNTERIWHPPQIRNISRFAVISGVKYGHSNANPQIYQTDDTAQWHDDGPTSDLLPYECVMRMAYRHLHTKNGLRRQGKLSGTQLFTEGYMANGVNLFGLIFWNYQGADGIANPVINSVDNPAHFYSGANAPFMGSSTLGDNPLGDGLNPESNDQELLNKFYDIADLTPVDAFEYQLTVYSIDPDSRWEIISLGLNDVESPIQAVELRSPNS